MRVAVVSPYDWSVPGGVQAQVEGLAKALQRAGAGVVVIAPVTGSTDSGTSYDFELVGIGKSVSFAANGSRAVSYTHLPTSPPSTQASRGQSSNPSPNPSPKPKVSPKPKRKAEPDEGDAT